MERNRIVFLGTCFSARTLLVLAPLLLATELVMLLLALRQGWLRDKLAGWVWLVRNGRTLFRRRRETQRQRLVRDRDLARPAHRGRRSRACCGCPPSCGCSIRSSPGTGSSSASRYERTDAPRRRRDRQLQRRAHTSRRAVESLLAQTDAASIASSSSTTASTDGSIAGLRRALIPSVELVAAGVNLGFAAANNLGVARCADCEFVALVNPDAFPEPEWLETLLAAADGTRSTRCSGAACCSHDDDRFLDGTGD